MAALIAGLTIEQEDEIVRHRLFTGTAVTKGLPLFKRIAAAYIKLSREAESGTTEQVEVHYRALLKELLTLKLQARKAAVVQDAHRREQAGHGEKQAQLESAIQQAQTDIKARKVELEEAKLKRQQLEEYEAVRHQVMQHPQRDKTLANIAQLEVDIEGIKADTLGLDEAIKRRKKQFALLLHAIDELQGTLDDEDSGVVQDATDATPDYMEEG